MTKCLLDENLGTIPSEPREILTPEQAQARLAEAERVIEEDAAEKKRQRRERLIAQLAQTRTELRQIRQEFAGGKAQFHSEEDDRARAQLKVTRAHNAMNARWADRPACADYLPADPDVIRWRESYEALDRKFGDLVEARDALPDPERLRNPLLQLNATIQRLEYAEQNLLQSLQGTLGQVRFAGGVFTVQ
jgi:chromosome segregation ATPase